MNVSSIRVIGFDLDQTLYPRSSGVDLAIQTYLYHRLADVRGCSVEEAGCLFRETYARLQSGSQTMVTLGFPSEEAGTVVQEALERADLTRYLVPDTRTAALLHDLRTVVLPDGSRQYYVDLITGSDRSNASKKLSALGLSLDLFDFCVFADDASKSDGAAYRLWLERYPLFSPSQFFYIGDRQKTDVALPLSLGMQAGLVYVTTIDPSLGFPQFFDLYGLRDVFLSR